MNHLSLTFGTDLSPVDALFFGPHPDDVELFAGGLAASLAAQGHRTAVCDLTRGEMGSLGTPESRAKEAASAAAVLGLTWRAQLGAPDGKLSLEDASLQTAMSDLVALIRLTKPSLIVCPYWEDRHPDHMGASKLISQAVFFSNLRKFDSDAGAPHEVLQTLYYPTRVEIVPSFVVDVSLVYPVKQKAIRCYPSQVHTSASDALPSPVASPEAPVSASEAHDKSALRMTVPLVSSPLSLSSLEARDAYCGAQVGTSFGEAYLVKSVLPIGDPVKHFREHRAATPLFYLR